MEELCLILLINFGLQLYFYVTDNKDKQNISQKNNMKHYIKMEKFQIVKQNIHY